MADRLMIVERLLESVVNGPCIEVDRGTAGDPSSEKYPVASVWRFLNGFGVDDAFRPSIEA